MNSSHQDKHFDAIFYIATSNNNEENRDFFTLQATNIHSKLFYKNKVFQILQRKVQLRTQLHRFLRTEDRYGKTKHTIRLAQTLRTCQNYPHLSTTNIHDKT